MHAGKLHTLLLSVQDEHLTLGVDEKIKKTILALTNISAQPADPSLHAIFKGSLDELRETLQGAPSNSFYPSERAILDEIGATPFIGDGLAKELLSVIESNNMTPASAASQLTEFTSRLTKYISHVKNVCKAFQTFHLETATLSPGKAEILISQAVPQDTVVQFAQFLKDIGQWQRALTTYNEVFSEDAEPVSIHRISSSDWQFYLAASPVVLRGVRYCLEQLNGILLELLKAKQLIGQLRNSKFSEQIIQATQKEYDVKSDTEIGKLAEAIVDESFKGDEGRKNELKTAMTIALGITAKKLASGDKLELKIEPLPAPEEKGEDENDVLYRQRLDQANEMKTLSEEFARTTHQLASNAEKISELSELKLLDVSVEDKEKK